MHTQPDDRTVDRAYAVIMAGGKGERFWPLSTSKTPKQMLALVGGKPLLAMSVDRLAGLLPPERVLVVTSADLVEASREVCPELPPENIFGEPFGRDTAAACALGTVLVKARDPNGIVCVMTADHVIRDEERFRAVLRAGIGMAVPGGSIITIGIKPTFPSTGFGYIEAGEPVDGGGDVQFFNAKRFVEKPDRDTAETYLEAGNFCWNSGMFIWSVETFESELKQHRPVLFEMNERLQPTVGTKDFAPAVEREYGKLEKISVDFAVMEKASHIVMAEGEFGWDDVGSWPALEHHFEIDEDGNVLIGNCEDIDSSGNVVVSDERLTALIGVKDLVVVQAPGATLICHKDRAQDVKKLVRMLGESGKHHDLL